MLSLSLPEPNTAAAQQILQESERFQERPIEGTIDAGLLLTVHSGRRVVADADGNPLCVV